MQTIAFVSRNARKVREIQMHVRNIQFEVVPLEVHEIQSLDLTAVATQKARDAYALLQRPLVVEDTSLVFHGLGGLPGPFIKWFLQTLGLDGLCQLAHVSGDPRATASVAFAYHDGQEVRVFFGTAEGIIATQPRGSTDFGWDPIFVPRGETQTWAELGPTEKQRASMRRQALEQLEAFVQTL